MAGIAGIIDSSPSSDKLELMLDAIAHRGGDWRQVHEAEGFCGGAVAWQLSPERGKGLATDGQIVVLLDGELYNDRPDGVCDAQMVLDLFKRFGRDFACRLNGVFACAIYDGRQVLLVRDSLGVRPLYWGHAGNGAFCFASELKAMVNLCSEAQLVPPACVVSSADGLGEYLPRWPKAAGWKDFPSAVRAVRRTLTKAVQRRIADGAVDACLLSGGLDSSIIAAIAYQSGCKLPLVTVGMAGAPDIEGAKIMAEHLGGEHHVEVYDARQVAQIVPRAVAALESFDEDCVSGAIANLFASAKARQFGNCVLSGEGGDELFGGYHLLKDIPDEAGRAQMMRRLVDIAHNTALQRLDRAMMANGINYRTPFLDMGVVALARQLPVRWKIHPHHGAWIEKHILREAFRHLLPQEIYARQKLHFAGGTGTDDIMEDLAPLPQPGDAATPPLGFELNSRRERWYHDLFTQTFPQPAYCQLVARWDPFK